MAYLPPPLSTEGHAMLIITASTAPQRHPGFFLPLFSLKNKNKIHLGLKYYYPQPVKFHCVPADRLQTDLDVLQDNAAAAIILELHQLLRVLALLHRRLAEELGKAWQGYVITAEVEGLQHSDYCRH